ncbi:hypothetical protein BCR33DRAFT_719386 [Rhizoclosmatium globosum]|uniref:Uncharacterized protein n=1 Tax=Rhizoclosmatium globosum TaxID=329046 RepID=A0A1Y2C033_9FUNG|nr:hypothetical protein BCR33DRAFT_719386 [Rhizoclosmatium globosum]|eukprot:ORY40388.1 hypothetical protein BCR33DRAFT_719386 [Rhizoclosmatium globosum]
MRPLPSLSLLFLASLPQSCLSESDPNVAHSIDFIYTTLLTFCFFWSSAYTAKYIAFPVWNQVETNPDSMNQFLAALSTIPVSLMISVCLHFCFATVFLDISQLQSIVGWSRLIRLESGLIK